MTTFVLQLRRSSSTNKMITSMNRLTKTIKTITITATTDNEEEEEEEEDEEMEADVI